MNSTLSNALSRLRYFAGTSVAASALAFHAFPRTPIGEGWPPSHEINQTQPALAQASGRTAVHPASTHVAASHDRMTESGLPFATVQPSDLAVSPFECSDGGCVG